MKLNAVTYSLVVLVALVPVKSLRWHNSSNASIDHNVKQIAQIPVITDWYYGHTTGRGIWKWDNALRAYQVLFLPLAAESAHPLKLGEVGVQSGGSLLMWKAVLGQNSLIYGFDINPACMKFNDASTKITIGDQADPNMWSAFFARTTPSLDILIDDGGHTPTQMLNTLFYTFPHINPGGFVVIEDIHGEHYLQSFYTPAAHVLGKWYSQGLVQSVHLYPYLLVVRKAGGSARIPIQEPAGAKVNDMEAMQDAINKRVASTISVQNPAWNALLAEDSLNRLFTSFSHLNGYDFYDVPSGCHKTKASVCANYVNNNPIQSFVTRVDIYPTNFVVHVASTPPVIQAVRMGTEWMGYGL